jgi:hypothetical protein
MMDIGIAPTSFLQSLSEVEGVERVVLSAEDESGGTDE